MLTVVGAAAANATTVTLPAHRPGDLLVVMAFRNGNATAPTADANYTTLLSPTSPINCSFRLAYRRATTSAETNPSMANTTQMAAIVLRGTIDGAAALGTPTSQSGTGTSVTYPALTLEQPSQSDLLVFGMHRSINTTITTPPTGTELVTSITGASAGVLAVFDNNPPNDQWAAFTQSVGGTSSGWWCVSLEIKAVAQMASNYLRGRSGMGWGDVTMIG